MDVSTAIEKHYFPHLVASYSTWIGVPKHPDADDTVANRIMDFHKGLSYTVGRNYIKIIDGGTGGGCVHSFIVIKPTKGFAVGDILKAASWNAPATNFKRGNVFCPSMFGQISWTGAC